MTKAYEICETVKISFKKIRYLIKNPNLTPNTELTPFELKIISNYSLKKQKQLEVGTKKKMKVKPKYPKEKGAPNPLNPNAYIYPNIRIINTPMGGKPRK